MIRKRIAEVSEYNPSFTTSDPIAVEYFNMNGNYNKNILHSVVRGLEDSLKYRNVVINGLDVSTSNNDIQIADGQCVINGRLVEVYSGPHIISLTSAGTYYVYVILSEDANDPRDVTGDTVDIVASTTEPPDYTNSLVLAIVTSDGTTATVDRTISSGGRFFTNYLSPKDNETDVYLEAGGLTTREKYLTLDGVNSKISVHKNIEVDSGKNITADTFVGSATKLGGYNASDYLRRNVNETVNGDWTISGDWTITGTNTFTVNVGNSTFDVQTNYIDLDCLNTVITGDLYVAGSSYFYQNVTVDDNPFKVTYHDITFNTYTFFIGQDTGYNEFGVFFKDVPSIRISDTSNFNIDGTTTINGTTTVNGTTNIEGDLTITSNGSLTVNSPITTNSTLSGTLNINGSLTIPTDADYSTEIEKYIMVNPLSCVGNFTAYDNKIEIGANSYVRYFVDLPDNVQVTRVETFAYGSPPHISVDIYSVDITTSNYDSYLDVGTDYTFATPINTSNNRTLIIKITDDSGYGVPIYGLRITYKINKVNGTYV